MYLVRLIYASKITEGFSQQDITNILETARHQNNKHNLTGLLCFSHDLFLQCLEGPRTEVNVTYQRILNDPRHSNIILLDYDEIVEREFDQWSMGYIPESSLTAPLNLKYSGTPTFDPYKMTGESVLRLLLALKNSVPTHN